MTRRLPARRRSRTVTACVAGHKLHVGVGFYADGSVGEIWIDAHKQGAFTRHALHAFAHLFSVALQYGAPLADMVARFRGGQFEPCGEVTGHTTITEATSLLDYVVRAVEELALEHAR